MYSQELNKKIEFLSQPQYLGMIEGIVRGIERESLRVYPDGSLSQDPHPSVFGSALTHPYITTDYSESLMEFITPASTNVDKTIAQLTDIHAHVVKNLGDEFLWPLSMPCYIEQEDDIHLANYGDSNVGQMKHLYRRGLKFRYGSFMQVISGIHFNISFPQTLWQAMAEYQGLGESSQDFQSQQYLHLIRNFKRNVWLLTYLYGASPALCGSFIGERAKCYPFESIGNGGLYLPYATSLRLSDLGYTSNAQSELDISYSCLNKYVEGLRTAIKTPVDAYQLPEPNPDDHAQLNNNLLQIENEYYSPIRPKRTTLNANEKPTDALAKRGIEYVEIRSLDINPFSPVGLEKSQIHFLDVFISYCLLADSPNLSAIEKQQVEQNHTDVILRGRDPQLKLSRGGESLSVTQWGEQIFDQLEQVAKWLDKAGNCDQYQQVVAEQRQAVVDPSLTLSAKFLDELKQNQIGSGSWGKTRAQLNKDWLLAHQPQRFDDEFMVNRAKDSVAQQQSIESEDKISFEDFLAQYFATE